MNLKNHFYYYLQIFLDYLNGRAFDLIYKKHQK